MKNQATIQGESNIHSVEVTYKMREAWHMEERDSDNDYIEILDVSGDLPSDFNDYREEYENEIIEQL